MQFTGIVESRVRELYYQVRSLTLSGSKQLADTTRCARVRNFQGNLARCHGSATGTAQPRSGGPVPTIGVYLTVLQYHGQY